MARFKCSKDFFHFSQKFEMDRVEHMGAGIVWIQHESTLVFAFRAGPVPVRGR